MLGEERLFDAINNSAKMEVEKNLIKDCITGKVTSINPLEVTANGIPLKERNLIIDEILLEHTVNFTNLTGTTENGTISISSGSFLVPCSLYKDDRVVVIELNNGKYYIAGKA